MKTKLMWLESALAGMAAGCAFAATSSACRIATWAEEDSRLWCVAHTNTAALPIHWPNGSDGARLTVVDRANATNQYSISTGTDTYNWQIFTGSAPAKENLYQLILSFYRGTQVLSAETATVAVISGAFPSGTFSLDTGKNDKSWKKIPDNAFAAYDSSWTSFISPATNAVFSLIKTGGATNSIVLRGKSGWLAFPTKLKVGDYSATLLFNNKTFASALLHKSEKGLVISLR